MFYNTKIGPFSEMTRGMSKKNMLYNIFLDLRQDFELLDMLNSAKLADNR